jgi:Winged helix-turn helix
MAAWRRAIEWALEEEDTAKLRSIAQSRTEPAIRVERARILLAYREDPSFFAVGRALGLHHQTVRRCVERAVVEGPMAALDDRPRPGRERSIILEARAWLVSLACRKAKDLGYPHELWTTRLRGFWQATPASMDHRRDMRASPTWRKARCARSWTRKR